MQIGGSVNVFILGAHGAHDVGGCPLTYEVFLRERVFPISCGQLGGLVGPCDGRLQVLALSLMTAGRRSLASLSAQVGMTDAHIIN